MDPNATGVQTVGWQPEPQQRGTVRLIVSCLVTLLICIWSAIHLNIPPGGGRQVLTKVSWTLKAILAPELITIRAWEQWKSAKLLADEVNKHLERYEDGTTSPRKHRWSIVHGFYAGMGGFAFELPPAQDRLYLTAHGVLILARLNLLPDISEDAIRDKSRADSVGKLLAVIQAIWLVVQGIARLVSRLPVTLLEVHTVAQVTSALIIWVLWRKKPMDVSDPTIITGEWTKSMREVMWVFSSVDESYSMKLHDGELDDDAGLSWRVAGIDNLAFFETYSDQDINEKAVMVAGNEKNPNTAVSQIESPEEAITTMPNRVAVTIPPALTPPSPQGPGHPEQVYVKPGAEAGLDIEILDLTTGDSSFVNPGTKLSPGQMIKQLGICVKPNGAFTNFVTGLKRPELAEFDLSYNALETWGFVRQGLKEFSTIWDEFKIPYVPIATHTTPQIQIPPGYTAWEYPMTDDKYHKRGFVVVRVDNTTSANLLQPNRSNHRLLLGGFTSLAYACLHIAAWNNTFPSTFEKWAWRASSCYLAAPAAVTLLMVFICGKYLLPSAAAQKNDDSRSYKSLSQKLPLKVGEEQSSEPPVQPPLSHPPASEWPNQPITAPQPPQAEPKLENTKERATEQVNVAEDRGSSFSCLECCGIYWGGAVLGAAINGFAAARGFLFIEAFISLRKLPGAAYDTPQWTQYFPHF